MIGDRLSDRYEIVSELGRGGMGVVYRARDPWLERDVAVKVIALDEISPEAEERFRREAQLVGQMDHPGIVPIYDLGSHRDFLFFVMPVVDGTTLQALIRQHTLELSEALEIVAQVAEALDYSHGRGVVHRDIKPENVMVTREQTHPRARVMDFGLALVGAASRLTRTGKLPGTLIYLSPEQILSAGLDGRSDLYSLGTILYECLAGAPPFSGSRYSLLYRIAHERPPSLVTFGIDAALDRVVASCLAKKPEDRPPRGNELAAALRRYAAELEAAGPGAAAEPRAGEPGDGEHLEERWGLGVTPLAGRRRETLALRLRVEEAFAGGCRFVAIGGEAGMGKTRLLRYAEELARGRADAVTLRGRFTAEDAFPYEGFGELVQDFFRHHAGEDVDLNDLGADLLALFPGLHEIPAVGAAGRSAEPALSVAAAIEDRTRIFELIARTLTRLAGGRPLLILLEQLHTSEAAIEALQYVLRRLGPTPTLIVGTYRPSEIGRRHPVARMLRAVKDEDRMSSLVLEPLDEDEHRELVTTLLAGARVSDDLVTTLYRASEGNPYFIHEWIRWLLETGDVWRDSDGTWRLSSEAAVAHEAMPETIQQVIEARLEQLGEDRLDVLRTASVIGAAFSFTDLEALAGADPRRNAADVDAAVDELIRDGWLEEEPRSRGGRLVFSSRLVRKSLYRSLPRRRRRLLHRRHAERLEARYAGRLSRVHARLVHHFAAADVAEKTVLYALELAREAVGGLGWEAAIRACRTALDFVDGEMLSGNAEGELRCLLAAALRAEGQLESAMQEAGRAVRVSARRQVSADGAEAALLAAEIAWQRRLIDETRKWVRRGAELARRDLASSVPSERTSACLGRLLNLESTLANLGGEYARAQALRREAEAMAPCDVGQPEGVPTGGTLVVSLPNALQRTEIAASATAEEVEVLSNVYETLLRCDEAGNLVPTLCREWEGSSRGRVFRFTLRDEVVFSDGSRLTSSDVKRSFERLAGSAELPAPAFRALEGIEELRGGAAPHLAGISVPEDTIVEFRLRRPLPIFPALLTDPRTAVVREPEAGSGTYLGTGPFRWPAEAPDGLGRTGERIVLERNPHDWRRWSAALDRLEFRILTRAYEAVRGLGSGEIDLARELGPDELEEVLRDPRFRSGLVEATQKNVFYVLFNSSGPRARQAEVRRALAGVIGVRDVVWRTLGRFAHPATGLMPPGVLGHDPGRRRRGLVRGEAAELLRSAAGSGPYELRGAVHPRFLERYGPLIEALLDEWSALGVDVDLETLEPASYLSRAADPTGLDFCFGRWDFAYDDPDNLAFEMLHSRFGRIGPYLGSEAADPLIERARQEVRASHRQRLYRKIEGRFEEQSILLPLFHDVRHAVRSRRVRGLRFLGSPPFVSYGEIGRASPDTARPRPRALRMPRSGSLHVPLPAALPAIDPSWALTIEVSEIVSTIFETLTALDEGAHLVPRLAVEFRLEEEGRRYRFRLRPGVRFHDGRRLTVRDVRYSFERLIRSRLPGAETPLLPIRGAHAFRDGEVSELAGFRVISERELVLELERPMSFFPAMLTHPATAVVPEGTEVFDSDWRRGTAGTGPFRVVRFAPGQRLELEANPHYWRDGMPRCDRLVFELGGTPESIAADFRAGKLSVASHLRPADVESLRRDPELAAGFREMPGFSTYYLVFDRRRGVLADLEPRRALAALLDVGPAVRDTLGRLGVEAVGLIPPGLPGHPQGRRPAASPDPEALRRLAGQTLRCVLHPAYRDVYAPFWQRLCDSIQAAGIAIETMYHDHPQIPYADIDAEVYATRWLADYPDSDTFAHLLHSREGIEGELCGDDELDRLIERGRSEAGIAARQAIYREIEEKVRRDALVVPLFHESIYRFARPEVFGLRLGLRSPFVAYEELGLRS